MHHTKRMQRTVKADARARLTLGLNFTPPGSNWRATRHPDGRITLEPLDDADEPTAGAVMFEESEAAYAAILSDSGNEEEQHPSPDEQDSEHRWFTQTLDGVSTDCVRCGGWSGKVGNVPCPGAPTTPEAQRRKNLVMEALLSG